LKEAALANLGKHRNGKKFEHVGKLLFSYELFWDKVKVKVTLALEMST
jgi:hypothetical protein